MAKLSGFKLIDLREKLNNNKVKFFIGDVRDKSSLDSVMFGVDYVFHAAALKHVPSCEFFPLEATKTNILGTENVLNLAEELHAYMKDNKESQGEDEDNSSKMLASDMDMDSGEDTAEQEGNMIYSGMQFSDDEGDTEESEEESTKSSSSSER